MKLKLWVYFGYTPSSSQIKVFITGGLLADITSYFAFQDFFRISLPPYLKKDVTCLYIQGKKQPITTFLDFESILSCLKSILLVKRVIDYSTCSELL